MNSLPTGTPKIPEAAFQSQVLSYATLRGWRTFHTRTAMNKRGQYRTAVAGDGAGWPDLFLVRADRAVAAELKTDTGRVSPKQRDWLAALAAAGIETHVWRPRDWDELTEVLK